MSRSSLTPFPKELVAAADEMFRFHRREPPVLYFYVTSLEARAFLADIDFSRRRNLLIDKRFSFPHI